jgi:hypothetical protein
MIRIPAVLLGGIALICFVFYAGYAMMHAILSKIFLDKKSKKVSTRFDSEKDVEGVSFVVGGIAVVITLILIFNAPEESRTEIWIGLTFAGIVASVISFVIAESSPTSKVTTTYEPQPQFTSTLPDQETRLKDEVIRNELRGLTEKSVWNWENFRSILICQGRIGEGCYIPAAHRPDYVYLDGFLPTVKELRELSAQRDGRETSRVALVDRERKSLVISGKTMVGSPTRVNMYLGSEPGREASQTPILTIHVHPDTGGEIGLSDQDYLSFLTDTRQVLMMICFRGGILFSMKTSSSPKIISSDTAMKWVSDVLNEMMTLRSNLHLPGMILAFNKEICLEFGMTLYQALEPSENVAYRIDVV